MQEDGDEGEDGDGGMGDAAMAEDFCNVVEMGRERRPTQDCGWSISGSSEPATARPR